MWYSNRHSVKITLDELLNSIIKIEKQENTHKVMLSIAYDRESEDSNFKGIRVSVGKEEAELIKWELIKIKHAIFKLNSTELRISGITDVYLTVPYSI